MSDTLKQNVNVYNLKNLQLQKIRFPIFWENAVKHKNNFYNYVLAEVKQYVDKMHFDKNYLNDNNCAKLWHRHCEFCFKEITLLDKQECYCSDDGMVWLCDDCFAEQKKKNNWQVKEADDIASDGVVLTQVTLANDAK